MSTCPLPMSGEFAPHHHQDVYIFSPRDRQRLRQYVDQFALIAAEEHAAVTRELAASGKVAGEKTPHLEQLALRDKARILQSYREQVASLANNPYPTVEDFLRLTAVLDGLTLLAAERVHQSANIGPEAIDEARHRYIELAAAIGADGHELILRDPSDPTLAAEAFASRQESSGARQLPDDLRGQFSWRIAALFGASRAEDGAGQAERTMSDPPPLRLYRPSQAS